MSERPAAPPERPIVLLIIDDSPVDRETLRRFLKSDTRHEYLFHERPGIEHGLAACREVQPDCILLDYSMADGTGLDFLKELPSAGGTRAFPVVMLTGSGSEAIAAQAFRAGAQDYLVKGAFTPDSLQRAIHGAIFKARAERLLDSQRVELERLFREAQAANARKDHFLAALSHELRTPLSPILTAVSSIDPLQASPQELVEIFATIRRNVELEARLIDDLLDLTRIANGKLRLDLEPVPIHQVIRHALDTCIEEITAKRLRLVINAEAREETVRADPARLQQVIWNLLKNAVKFTPEGGEIVITTRNTSPDLFQLEVRDTGSGIAEEVLPKIFDAFEQGGTRITHRFGGLGLGLAISRALIDAHGGEITAHSSGKDCGSRFVVTLPVVAAPPARVAPPASTHPPGAAPRSGSEFSHLRVLLVEDHADSARILSRTMERHGYQVVVAGSMSAAIEIFQREKIAAVISDIGLPDGDGVKLMESLYRIAPVPGIALSGYGMEQDLARSRAAGFVEHLTKPVDWPQLEAALKRLLAGVVAEGAVPATSAPGS